MQILDVEKFIREHITKRNKSLFGKDLDQFRNRLQKEINGKSALVIGGAGTIGSSFIRALLKYEPSKLVVVDTNENGLTELTRDLRSRKGQFIPESYIPYPMNFADQAFRKMFQSEGPFDIVANFAAHKHVRSEKDQFSIEAMLENNVFKAAELLEFLKLNPPKHFFCVSTDKAANPVNVMGASKKLMEETIMAYSREYKISTARFANVAFSNGSLLDGYIQRFMKNQPLSCPSDVKRFFVSPDESGQICLMACILGETGDIFFPKLSSEQLVNFKDITEDLFKFVGHSIDYVSSEIEAKEKASTRINTDPYPVYFFPTDTSGEKLYEEFYVETDLLDTSSYRGMSVIKNAPKPKIIDIRNTIGKLRSAMDSGKSDKADIVSLMKESIPNFEHIETGKKLDDKM